MGAVRDALEVTIASSPTLSDDRNAALLALCRMTADRLDAQGDRPSGQIIAAYLSALKDLERAMSGGAKAAPRKAGTGDATNSALGALRGIKGGRAG